MPRTILLLGESIPWGWAAVGGTQTPVKSPTPPGASLQTLLTYGELAGNPWQGATVRDYAVPSATTRHWTSGPPYAAPMSTTYLNKGIPALDYAVAHGCALLAAVDALLAGQPVDLVLFLEGIADSWAVPLAQTITNLTAIRDHFAPVPVLMSRPVSYCIPPDCTPFPTWSATIGDAMAAAGLVNGPVIRMQPPRQNPNGSVDWLHFTDAGYWAVANTWRDAIVGLV